MQQWITIRGRNQDNPAVVILHGGPGVAYSAISRHLLPWERDLTVIQWDQRGAGKSYISKNSPPSIETMVQDALEVSDYVRHRLHKDKVILLAHSWGTVLGIKLVKAHPELFYAYVGTGQVVNMQRNEVAAYARVLAKAQARGDSGAIAALEKSSPPPYQGISVHSRRGTRCTFNQVRLLPEFPPNTGTPPHVEAIGARLVGERLTWIPGPALSRGVY